MQLLSPPAPSLQVIDRYGDIFNSLDATEFWTDGPTDVTVKFPFGTDESAFSQFVRDEIDGVKLTLTSNAYHRCAPPLFDAERAVSYLGKATGVTGVEYQRVAPNADGLDTLFVHTSDEQAAALLRSVLKDTVNLPGEQTTAQIVVAPGEG